MSKRVFIVPYRNRIQHKFFFSQQMTFLLEGETNYEIYFVHQTDSRTFNRGAMKNIGFLAMKKKYPDTYQDMTFIFNDVDTLPFHKLFDYQTEAGVVKHYYGFESALGGIVVMKGADFEKVNGFPNFWGWGMEDACLQKRCLHVGLHIDRSNFYPIGSPEILQLFDGVSRLVCSRDPARMKNDNGVDGLSSIHKLTFGFNKTSTNLADDQYTVDNQAFQYINVLTFMTAVRFDSNTYHEYDLREPVSQVAYPDKSKEQVVKPDVVSTNSWKNIPFYPTVEERNHAIQQYIKEQHQKKQQPVKRKPNTQAFASVNIGLGGIR